MVDQSIELAFARLKAFLRAARPRSFDHVCSLVAIALELLTLTSVPRASATAVSCYIAIENAAPIRFPHPG